MNSLERVMNTLAGRPTDRTPVFAVLSAYGGKLTHTDLRTLYTDAKAYVNAQQVVQQTFGFDLVLSPFDYCAISEAFGGEIAFFEDQPPNMKRPATTSAAKVLSLSLPDPRKTGRLPTILEATRQLSTIYEGRVPLFAAVPGCCIFPSLIMGLEAWIDTVLFDESMADKILEHTADFFVDWANALVEVGVNALIVPEGMATAEIMPRSLFAERFLPHLHRTLARVDCPVIFHHTGGRIGHVLDLLPGLPRLAGVVIGPKEDLNEARRLLGPELTLAGNIDNMELPALSEEEVRRKCMECLCSEAANDHYILSNSGPDIPLNTPLENLHAMMAASCEYAEGAKVAL